MNYSQTIEFLYTQLPMFQRVGKAAYKADLENTLVLDNLLENPHKNYDTIHIAGTNGKGSVSSYLASIFMEAGFKTGLYTSPHLVDFCERMRINGNMITEQEVIDFVQFIKSAVYELKPSFFEISTAMAFQYFAQNKVDIAIIETGMGGRLDCTNIINPKVSVITNIGLDHQAFLGNTLEQIASEKAGIIKQNIPIIIGEHQNETDPIFNQKAISEHAPIIYAQDNRILNNLGDGNFEYYSQKLGTILFYNPLQGYYQRNNLLTVFASIEQVVKQYNINTSHIIDGIKNVQKNSGIRGRWEVIGNEPLIVCDTGHNKHGLRYVVEQIKQQKYNRLFFVLAVVNDKDINEILPLFPSNAYYLFTQADIPRALPAQNLMQLAIQAGLKGELCETVSKAIEKAKTLSDKNDMIFIGGSTFTVADALK